MTLCIGAQCKLGEKWAVVNLADTRREKGGIFEELVGSEDASKIATIGPPDKLFTVLVSRIPTKAIELIAACKKSVEEFAAHPGGADSDMAVTHWLQALRRAAEERKKEIIDHHLQMSLGIPRKEFLENGSRLFSPDHYNQLWAEVRGLDLGADLLFTGFFDDGTGTNESILVRLDRLGQTHWEAGYAVTGIGSDIALAFLCQREYRQLELMECLFRVYEAKTAAQRNRHVGQQTMIVITVEGRGKFRLTPKGWTALKSSLVAREPAAFEEEFIKPGE